MIFSSLLFLCVFLPLVLAGYYLINPNYRNVFLLISSLVFYAWGEPTFVLIMLLSILGNYGFGLLIDSAGTNVPKKKICLVLALIFNIGLLFFFKYFTFTVINLNKILLLNLPLWKITLPLGISFFTFHGMSYIIDLYRGKVKVQKNPLIIGLYISLFPQLIAGPIIRYVDVQGQFFKRDVTVDKFTQGAQRFIIGLSKKVLIANIVGETADKIFNSNYGQLSTASAWVGLICYTLQIYFDFSGYSDMAIGLGKMFGFDFLENFNYPYISKSISEFWRRWHISLSTWFRDFLYIPMGGSRRGNTYINLFIVFVVTGIWHGASWNFLGWGLWHGFFITIDHMLKKKNIKWSIPSSIQWLYTLFIIMMGWVMFRVNGLHNSIDFYKVLFHLNISDFISNSVWYYLDKRVIFTIILGILAALPWKSIIFKQNQQIIRIVDNNVLRLAETVLLLLISIILLANSSYNPFIYYRF